MNLREYVEAVQRITARHMPKEIKEKRNSEGKLISKVPVPWSVVDAWDDENSMNVALWVPSGYSILNLEKQIDALYAAVGGVVKLIDLAGVVVVSKPLKDFPSVIPFKKEFLTLTEGRSVLIGFDILGEPVIHNFRVPSILIGAMPGYGKTDIIRWIIFQLISRFTPDELWIDIVDGKGFSFMEFMGIPHIRNIVDDLPGILDVMERAHKEVERRKKAVKAKGSRGIKSGFRWHMVFVDELAYLSPYLQTLKTNREIAAEAYSHMAAVACVGREAGVGMVLCTQRPDANVVHGQVKQGMDVSIAFRTKTATNSEIILDHAGAEQLPQNVPGRGIYSATKDIIFQAPYIGPDKEEDLTEEDRERGLTSWETILAPYKYECEEPKDERGETEENFDDVQ